MKKSFTTAIGILAAGMLLANAWGQQAAPTSAQQTPATKTQHTSAATTPQTSAAKPNALVLTTQKDKISYAIGMNVGANLHKQAVDVDPAVLLQGLKDGIAGSKPLLSEEEARAVLMQLQEETRKKQAEKAQQMGAANKTEGETFLAANKNKEGVITLPSGLQYKILQAGTGPKPAATDSVVCNYRGTLINGTEFDSSYKRGQPATFPVNGVIKGWTEALQLMPVGSKWQLFVPAQLAYGDRGAGADIGPNATLIFEVELLSIQAKSQ
ncbi:MAG: FKBP-type peptidyl-prolyl cis-trans isomerase [Candidatus Korobacteraceae bacterium]|jgi:FKBP-type peptidyl-prolyl cis-trans isomerase